MTQNIRDRLTLGALPSWAERFIERHEENYDLLSGPRAERNFPDDRVPRWLRGETRPAADGVPEWIDSFFRYADPSLRETWIDEGFLSTDPEWLAELVERDRADVARVFMLTGNVHDYAFSPERGYRPIIDRIEESAVQRKDWVLRYSLSNGFATPVRGSATPEGAPTPFEDLGVESVVEGGEDVRARSPQETLDRDFRIMDDIFSRSYDGGVTLVVDNLHLLTPPDPNNVNQNVLTDAITRWAKAPWMFRSNNQVILLSEAEDQLTRDLTSSSSHIESIRVPRPDDRRDRLKFLVALFAGGQVTPMTDIRLDAATRPVFDDAFGSGIAEKLDTLAARTSGLNRVGLENLALQINARSDQDLTIDFIKEAKRDLLSRESGGLLDVSEPDANVDREAAFEHVGGLHGVRDKLVEISQLMERASSSPTIQQSLPSGLLFLGPPGTGKTLVARAFANACGVNFAELGNIRSMYVGESERNLSQALDLIRSMTPVVVFVDEIDQTMGQRGTGTDSGVDQRLFARLLQFMSDPELDGEVIWIGASNEPTGIDPALKRAGRFDLTVPFLRPSAEARREILEVHLNDRGATVELTEAEWDVVLEETSGYTGAELERVAKEALWTQLVDGAEPTDVVVELSTIRAALAAYQPPANRDEMRRMEDQALTDVTAVDMLTDEQRNRRERLMNRLDD